MGRKQFSIKKAVGFGWDTMKANIGFFIALLTVAALIQVIPRLMGNFVAPDFPIIAIILYLIATVLEIVVSLGLLKISVKFCDGIKGKLDDLLSSFHLVFSYFAASVVYILIILGGLLLFIVPGIIWSIKYSLFPYFIADGGLGPIEAIKASGKATKGAKFDLFLFGFLLGLINLGGVLAFVVGLFATIPTTMVAYAYTYRQLAGKKISKVEKPAPKSNRPTGPKGDMYINLEAPTT